jgi:hypothetical protein
MTATATSPASAAWTSFTTADGEPTFDLPAAWSVRDPAGELPAGGGAFAEVTNRQASRWLPPDQHGHRLHLHGRYPYSVRESQELPALAQGGAAPVYIFKTRRDDAMSGLVDTRAAAYGIETGTLPR